MNGQWSVSKPANPKPTGNLSDSEGDGPEADAHADLGVHGVVNEASKPKKQPPFFDIMVEYWTRKDCNESHWHVPTTLNLLICVLLV
jgi:hypothetical protein